MNIDEFWLLTDDVHTASSGDMDDKCTRLKDRLQTLSDSDLQDYSNHFYELEIKAYTWDLWAAAWTLFGGCSDDMFSDFRASLISHGRAAFEGALQNPEFLAEIGTRIMHLEYEGYQYVVDREAKVRGVEFPAPEHAWPDEPSGEEWDESAITGRFPALEAWTESEIDEEEEGDDLPLKKPWWRFW